MKNRNILIINFIIMILLVFGVCSMIFFLPILISTASLSFIAGLFLVLILFGLYTSIMQLRNKDENHPKLSFFNKLLLYSPIINVVIVLGIYLLLSGLN